MFPSVSKADAVKLKAWDNLSLQLHKQWDLHTTDDDVSKSIYTWHIPSCGQKPHQYPFAHMLHTCWQLSLQDWKSSIDIQQSRTRQSLAKQCLHKLMVALKNCRGDYVCYLPWMLCVLGRLFLITILDTAFFQTRKMRLQTLGVHLDMYTQAWI